MWRKILSATGDLWMLPAILIAVLIYTALDSELYTLIISYTALLALLIFFIYLYKTHMPSEPQSKSLFPFLLILAVSLYFLVTQLYNLFTLPHSPFLFASRIAIILDSLLAIASAAFYTGFSDYLHKWLHTRK